jgi:hypothetical protein
MQFNGIAEPEQLGVLRQALDQYCLEHDITRDDDRDHIASLIIRLFGRGLTSVDEILPALEEMVALYGSPTQLTASSSGGELPGQAKTRRHQAL